MGNRTKVSTTVYIEAEQDELLHRLSERTGVSIAEHIRDGFDMILARAEREAGIVRPAPVPPLALAPLQLRS